jgi:hypothetical protein
MALRALDSLALVKEMNRFRSAFLLPLLAVTVSTLAVELHPGHRLTDRSQLWEHSSNILSGFCNMYQMEVVRDDRDWRFPYHGWFFGWAAKDCNPGFGGCDAIFALRSARLESGWQVYMGNDRWDDGTHPASWVPIITARNEFYDGWHNGDPSVVLVGGRFYMAYSSVGRNKDGKLWGEAGDKDGSLLCVMGAISDDGLHWRRTPAPIAMNLLDVGAPPVPEGEAHLYGSYHRPSLLYEAGKFRLWFDYWAGATDGVSVGYAENAGDFMDPKAWRIVQAGATPVLRQFPNPDVVKIREVYFMYGDPATDSPHQWISRRITEAVSTNGRDWVVLGYVKADRDTPATHVPQAYVQRDGAATWIYVFYACQIGGEPQYNYRYDRIRFMRRKVTDADLAEYRVLCRP